ncbi:hypothetical protein KEM55_005431 [Ascosphaera atra]|nr:hypothetical protein KEM55_005431 [Ascosphaera atra]
MTDKISIELQSATVISQHCWTWTRHSNLTEMTRPARAIYLLEPNFMRYRNASYYTGVHVQDPLRTMASIAMLNSASYKHVPIMLRAALRSQRNYTTDQLAELIKMNVPERKLKYVPETGTYPKGFQVGAAHAGVKASNTTGYPDIALISSVGETPCRGAGLFTRNKFQAAPVQVSRKLLGRKRPFQINNVIINAGCANAVTGKKGLEDAESMVRKTDEVTGQPENSSLVMSTGVIGQA